MNCVIKREYIERNRLYNSYKRLNADDKWEAGKSQYHRNKAQQRYENRIDTQVVQKNLIDIIRSYDNARNVLIHSYQAAFLMEKNTSASFKFNHFLEPLETIYYQFKKALYSGTDEEFAKIAKTADRIDKVVNELLSGFDL